MWRTLALPLVLCAAALPAKSASPGDAAYRHADALFVAQKFSECQIALDEALRLDAKLVPALTLQAKLAMAVGRFDVARASLERALDADPGSAYARFLYGFQFYLTNDLHSALPQLERARKLNPLDPRAALYLGLTLESLGQTDRAMSLYEQSVRLERAGGAPQPDTLLVGARLLLLMGHLDECERWIEQSLKLAPDSRDAHFEKARLLLREGQAAAAAAEGDAALRLKGGSTLDSQIHYLLVRAYRESGSPDRADQHAEALRLLDPAN